jgi:RNA polymerase sigma-70 factor (ECF subfamily)
MTSDERTAETCSINGRVEAVYRKQAAQMWRALLAYSGDPDIASDAVAEAFAQALRRGSAIRQVDRWVWRASFRIAAGELKERRRLVAVVDVPDGIPDTGFGLQDSLLKLSPKQRSSLFLYYYGGYPPRDIASMIGSTPSAVRVHLHCGRKRLAETLNGVSDD